MKSWAQPTADELERVAILAARPVSRAYFFDRLENPNWIAPLAERGLFADPPPPVPANEPGYVRFPPWPEGRYLVRMASVTPEQVAAVLVTVDISENPVVMRLLMEATGSLPEAQLRQLSQKIRYWITAPRVEHFVDEAAVVVVHLLDAGAGEEALEIIASLLEIQSDPQLAEKITQRDSPVRPLLEATARFSEWHFEQALNQILIPAVDSIGIPAVSLFADLLDDAIRMSKWEDEVSLDEDFSHIWRPAIENHVQNSETGIRNLLVSTVRDAALQFASRGVQEVETVVQELESRSTVHKRIALHVLTNIEEGAELVVERITNRELFDDYRIRHEYAELLRNWFMKVDTSVQQQVLSWIEAGPDVDEYRRRRFKIDGAAPDEEDIRRYIDLWKRDRYCFVASHLEGTHLENYQALVNAFGEPEHPEFVYWSTSWSGPESPITQDELHQRSPEEVVEYLRQWRPEDDSGWHFGPSIEGLGRVLDNVVAARVSEFTSVATLFRDLDPTYVRGFFSGLLSVLRENKTFPWEEPIALAEWVAAKPFEPDVEVSYRDRDPGWRWCRGEIASLIRSGLTAKENQIPFEFRDRVWAIIERLTWDPNPSPDYEASYGGENMDPLTLSINTNRGKAMHAVSDYALWCHRQLEAQGEEISGGFKLIAEVRGVLERHLDPDYEPSLAVRSVYGRWLPWLILLDEEWTVDHLPLIFPVGAESTIFADAAWSTYIVWCPPYDSAMRILHNQYEKAITQVPSGNMAGTFGRKSVDSKLGEHLVTFFWRGVIEREFLEQYFDRAGDDIAAQVLGFAGHALRNTTGEIPGSVRERFILLWERRYSVGSSDPEEHCLELRAFGTWFASKKFDETWALAQLDRVVDLVGAPILGHLVAEYLVDLVPMYPATVARVFTRMIEHPEHEWDLIGWRDEARGIVEAAIDSDDDDAIQYAREIVDIYVRQGEVDFRDLLS